MARPPSFKKNSMVISVRFDADEYQKVQDIAALETFNTGKIVCSGQLIREAVKFVYSDGERMRECFRRSREGASKKIKGLELNKHRQRPKNGKVV